jgi:hypothetical protein
MKDYEYEKKPKKIEGILFLRMWGVVIQRIIPHVML